MARINPDSFKFRIGVSFLLLGVLIIFLLIASFFIIKSLDNKSREIAGDDQKAIQGIYELTNHIQAANVLLNQYISTRDGEAAEQRQLVWDEAIAAGVEDLRKAFGKNGKAHVDDVETQMAKLRNQQQEIEDFVKSQSLQTELQEEPAAAEEFDMESAGFSTDVAAAPEDEALQKARRDSAKAAGYEAYMAHIEAAAERYAAEIPEITAAITSALNQLASATAEKKSDALSGFNGSLNFFQILILACLLVMLALALVSFGVIDKTLRRSVEKVKEPLAHLSKGDLPPVQQATRDELGVVIDEINLLSENFGNIKNFALEVGQGNFETDINVFNNEGEIGRSLFEMRNSLKKVAEEEKERSWMNEGFARFGDILRQSGDNLSHLSEAVISQLVKYLNANQGGIFIINDEDKENVFLELTGCYAYERKKYLKKQVQPGEGLVGQCYLEKMSIYMTNVPADYINIKSGLGGSNPGNVFIAPLKLNEEVYGIIELASFNKLESFEMDFVEKVAESIASTISSVKVNEHTKKLLEESQMAAEQLKAQEEEMRQNMEELAATQEEMHRNQKAVNENEQKTRLIFLNAFDAIITTDDQGSIDLFNPAAEKIFGYAAEELKDRRIEMLIPGIKTLGGEKFSLNEIAIIEGRRKSGELFKARMKVEEGNVGSQKIYLAFIEDLAEEKEQQGVNAELLKKENEQLSERARRFDALTKSEAFCFAVVNKDGSIAHTNDAATRERELTHINDIFPDLPQLGGYEFLADFAALPHDQSGRLKLKVKGAGERELMARVFVSRGANDEELLLWFHPAEETEAREVESMAQASEQIAREKLAETRSKLKRTVEEEQYVQKKMKK